MKPRNLPSARPLRSVKNWSRYVRKSAYGVPRHFKRWLDRANLKTPKTARQQFLRAVQKEMEGQRHTHRWLSAIMADTTIKSFGLNRVLSPRQIKGLKEATIGIARSMFVGGKIKNNDKKASFAKKEADKYVYKIAEIVGEENTKLYLTELFELRDIVLQTEAE